MWKYDKAVIQNDLEFLQHHGILGMKWGIRRYQNKDGTLTPEGRERYNALLSKGKSYTSGRLAEMDRKTREKAGIKNVDKDHDVIKKNSAIYRFSTKNEATGHDRKYGSLIRDDVDEYESSFVEGELGDLGDSFYKLTYKATKDLKVATPKKVTEFLVNKYGDLKLSDIAKNDKIYKNTLNQSKYKNLTMKEVGKILADYDSEREEDPPKIHRIIKGRY